MYEKLIAELRQHHCDAREDDTQEVCEECAYDVIIADKSVPSGISSVCVCGLMHRAADAIEELTAADVRPVVRGKWLNDFCGKGRFSKRIVQCSLCGNFLDLDGVNAGRGDANYCPNCGARMDAKS